MLQALVKRGKVVPTELPPPLVEPGTVLVKTVRSCVSAGTELADVAKSGRGLIRRALDQPQAFWKFLSVLRSEGLGAVRDKVTGEKDIGSALGYSAAGIVIAAGSGVEGFLPGDRVAAAGVGIANHAEYIQAPRSMLTRIPDSVSFDAASTAALGAVALHAARRASLAPGEFAVVYGAGAIGQLVIQILAASCARVIAVDIEAARLAVAQRRGAEACVNPLERSLPAAVRDLTGGYGADAVIYCASAGDSAALSACASCARRRGRIVLVGTWAGGMDRSALYARELDLLISTSYGPGRYDERYENGGIDYPYAYVRWTEGRNLAEYLRLLAARKVIVDELIDSRFPVRRAGEAFERLQAVPRPLLVLLDYGAELPASLSALQPGPRVVQLRLPERVVGARGGASRRIRVGVIGAGRFATGVHLPNLCAMQDLFELRAVCCRTGSSAMAAARRFDAGYATTDHREVLADPLIDCVLVCTGPALHAAMAIEALRAGKSVFVEKPLCVRMEELGALDGVLSSLDPEAGSPVLSVGFNRRFSPCAREMKLRVQGRTNPLFLRYRMNAGYQAPKHPGLPPEDGGRIVGEACHAVDLASFLCGSPVRAYGCASVRPSTTSLDITDNASIALEYEDGSVAVIDYIATGSPELPKEQLEAHFDGVSIVLDNFQGLRGYGISVPAQTSPEPRKGHREELAALADHLRGTQAGWPIPWESIRQTTEITLALAAPGPNAADIPAGAALRAETA